MTSNIQSYCFIVGYNKAVRLDERLQFVAYHGCVY